MGEQFKNSFLPPDMNEKIRLLPSLTEVFLGQEILAAHCLDMMNFARTGNAAEMYDYYRRLGDLISDEKVMMLITPLLFRGEHLVREYRAQRIPIDECETEQIRSI